VGRTALVTGAAGGIGRRIAAALAAAGHDVAVCDRDERVRETAEELARAEGVRSAAGVFDIADAEAVSAGVAELAAELAPFDVLVSNAAIVDQIAPALEFPADGWQRELGVNLSGAFWAAQATAPAMVERGFGRIVVISSGAATGGLPGQVAYSASKAGLLGMVRTLATELAPAGVTCNAILPGLIGTEKVKAMPDQITERALRRIPAGRVGEMEEVAALVAFLCSEQAGYVTGACIPIDGGQSLNTLGLSGNR
jgi:NAD(P)-dependent dehydrogenase (short-subunit alcohol dehydrogenase family)